MAHERIIDELIKIILRQDKEIDKLKTKVKHIKQYIEVYEEYIKGGDSSGD